MANVNDLKKEVIAELRAQKEAEVKTTITSILKGIITQQGIITTAQKTIATYQKQLASLEIETINEKDFI